MASDDTAHRDRSDPPDPSDRADQTPAMDPDPDAEPDTAPAEAAAPAPPDRDPDAIPLGAADRDPDAGPEPDPDRDAIPLGAADRDPDAGPEPDPDRDAIPLGAAEPVAPPTEAAAPAPPEPEEQPAAGSEPEVTAEPVVPPAEAAAPAPPEAEPEVVAEPVEAVAPAPPEQPERPEPEPGETAGAPAEGLAAGLGGAASLAETGEAGPVPADLDEVEEDEEVAIVDETGADEGTGPRSLVGRPELFRNRWEDVQVAFVDEPRGAVEDADQLVVELIDEVAAGLTRQREELAAGWRGDPDTSTEDLRQALRRYRTFFDQLVSS